jgi:hypothetical protein
MAPTATAKRELSLANAMRELDAGNRNRRVRERFESSHRRAASLDGAVVLLDQVIQIVVRPNLHVAPARVLTSQQPQCASTRHVSVERHFARHTRKRRGKRFTKERLCGRDAAVAARKEVDGLAVLINGAVQVMPLRSDRNVRLVDPPPL